MSPNSFGPFINNLFEEDDDPTEPVGISGEELLDLTDAMKKRIADKIDAMLMEVVSRPLAEYQKQLTPLQSLILYQVIDTVEPKTEEIERMSQHDLVFNTIVVFVTVAFIVQDRLERDLFDGPGSEYPF